MNCDLLQRRLLNLERPDRPPAEVQAHLAGCPSCREWQRRLVRLERGVALLPVPASTAKGAFVARLRAGPRRTSARQPNGAGNRGQRREFALQKLALATSLAAGLVLFAVIWWALQWSGSDQKAPGDLLAQLVHNDMELAKATNQANRLEALAAVADDLQAHAKPLCQSDDADDLKDLAGWYKPVVAALPEHTDGEATAASESLARRLDRAERSSQDLLSNAPAPCADALRDMAATAHEGAQRLRSPQARSPQPPRAHAALPGARMSVLSAGVTPVMAVYLVPATVPGTLFASGARGASPDSAADQVQRFRQNHNLLRTLVEEAVRLAEFAGDQEALDRAAHCNKIARQLAAEMKTAAHQQQGARLADLGKFLKSVLQDGVASNLSTARTQLGQPQFSMEKLRGVRDETMEFVEDLDQTLQNQDGLDGAILTAVHQGQEEVQKALEEAPHP